MAAIGEGVDADFLRSVAVRKALHRAYVHDEPVYMIAHELIQLWQAEVVIRRERVFDSDRRVIRDAHRSQRQWRLR